MGQTLLGGLLRAGRDPGTVLVVDRRAGRAKELHERFGVRVVDDVSAVAGAATVLLAVKPQDLLALLDSIAGHLDPDALVVSLAAGVTTAAIEARLPAGTAVVRVMPNTPSLVDEGMAGLAGGSSCADEQLAEAEDLLRSCGRTVVLAEKHLDAVTALSGSGPRLRLLRRGGDGRGRGAAGAAARDGDRARGADRRGCGGDAARDGAAPDRPARAGRPRPRARRPRRCASSTTPGSAPRWSRPSRPPPRARSSSRAADVRRAGAAPEAVQVVWDPKFNGYDFGRWHPMAPVRLDLTARLCRELGLFDRPGVQVVTAEPADDDLLTSVHDPAYVAAVKAASADPRQAQEVFGLGTEDDPAFPGMHEAAARIVGGSVDLGRALWSPGAPCTG